jgi:putative membrane protein
MKNIIILINLAILFAITSIFTHSDNLQTVQEEELVASSENAGAFGRDSSVQGKTAKSNFALWTSRWDSETKSVANRAEVDFFNEMTEARIVDLEQGKTASQRATNRPLKDYGSLMVKDQSKMLKELRALAAEKRITIPASLSADKAGAIDDLLKLHGESFDKKYIRMMIADHKRDIKKLERATRSTDPDIQVFATKYLPVVQSHLARIKTLKKRN